MLQILKHLLFPKPLTTTKNFTIQWDGLSHWPIQEVSNKSLESKKCFPLAALEKLLVSLFD